jgi:hypothetical protein
MHRSGTSCLAGMLAAGGVASAGEAVRNWDNARGHHEMLDLVRLDEAVLAHSGGHYLAAPSQLRWTDDHAAERDRLLRATIGGRPALLKDPRMLLTLPFWRASQVPFQVIGIVRHPLAVARSLETWRGMPLPEGLALWTAHNRALADDRARHGYPVVDFDAPKASVVAAVAAVWPEIDLAAAAAAYEETLVHHDPGSDTTCTTCVDKFELSTQVVQVVSDPTLQLHRELVAGDAPAARPAFPRAHLAAFRDLVGRGATAEALAAARAALAEVRDAAAVLVPVVTALVRRGAYGEARALVAEQAARLDDGLADLLHGKLLLAAGDAAGAVHHLEAACRAARPLFAARSLRPQALRAAGRHGEARVAMQELATAALYPHGPLATLAEWSRLDGERHEAVAQMQRAIEAAPLHRRGRLRTRLAEWLLEGGDPAAAQRELAQAIAEDPGYPRSREVLARITRA